MYFLQQQKKNLYGMEDTYYSFASDQQFRTGYFGKKFNIWPKMRPDFLYWKKNFLDIVVWGIQSRKYAKLLYTLVKS